MTTIATDGRSMAGDGLECQAGTITGLNVVKVRRLSDGRLVGVAGEHHEAVQFAAWLEGGDKPKIKVSQALVLHHDGSLFWFDCNLVPVPCEVPAAIGSGMDFALAAMDAGLAPERAVAVAAQRNTDTGGTITVLHLEPSLSAVEAA